MADPSEILKRTRVLRDRLRQEIERFGDVESRLAGGDLSADMEQLKDLSREHARLGGRVDRFRDYLSAMDSLEEAVGILADSGADQELREMAKQEAEVLSASLETEAEAIQLLLLPADPDEGKNMMMEIRAGTGGDEASLFAMDLMKMYLRFADKAGLRAEILYLQETELGGCKEVALSLQGAEAFALLHREGGAHRVQRIPVTESGGRIHTSAVTVAVLPEVEEEEVSIDDKDLKIDTFRAGGAGGQHVNKTDSAIRILHIPTGIVVSCQDERSQLKNKIKAMRVLRARIGERRQSEAHADRSSAKKEQVGSGDRSERIRTYNFPQGRVTDHRIGFTSYNLDAFMQGEMTELLDLLRKDEREEKMRELEKSAIPG